MKNAIFISLLASTLILAGCSIWKKPAIVETETNKPVIVTSFFPITHLVEKMVGDQAQVVQLLPIGAEAHDYAPTPNQMRIIEESDLVIVLGESMEQYAGKLEQERVSKNKGFLDFTESVMNLEAWEDEHHEEESHSDHEAWHHHEGMDPHIWLSPRAYASMADVIEKKIKETLPDINIEASSSELKTELNELDESFVEGLQECDMRTLVTSHAAFGYLARDYRLSQIAVAGISPEEEPSPKTIAEIIDLIKKDKITALFSEPLVSPKLINTIAAETGAKTYLLHPLESLSEDETSLGYVGVMKQNLTYIREWLGCK